MTIGIAAYGPEAGRAILEGAMAAEILGRGSIRGFAVLSVLDVQGAHQQLACQNGGLSAIDGIEAFYEARCAALISSGPNRPEPLSQFLVGLDSVGLVTGHRLPQREGASGLPLNISTLQRIKRGEAPIAAVHAELSENPESDCGLIAVSADGRIGFGNSARVERRSDLMEASLLDVDRGYALLGNSVYFNQGCQPGTLIGDLIWSRLSGHSCGFFIAQLSRPVPVLRANEDRIELDEDGCVIRIFRADPWIPAQPSVTTVVYSRALVVQGGRPVGACMSEVFALLEGGTATPDAFRQTFFAIERW